MISVPELETARLFLRPVTLSDVSSIAKEACRIEISDTMISIPHPYPEGEAVRYVSQRLSEMNHGKAAAFVIEHKPDRKFAGIIEIRDIEPEHAQAEVSFWLGVGLQGQGYMSEAIACVVRFGFENLGLNRIYAHHMVRNPASGRALMKNGFLVEGLLRQRVRKWGVFEDVVLLALLREDWEKAH